MSRRKRKENWWRVDLHVHTPASSDFEQPGVSYLDILKKAEDREVDILAFTDHNTVAGYRALRGEIDQLTWLESEKRIQPDERQRLEEYRRLMDEILVLPGFEFTATFGFHLLAIFSPTTNLRTMEHLLIQLRVPVDQLDGGATEVGATSDVLTAYRLIAEAGGLVIAAHADSAHGVAMRGLNFGGQTKIAWTQDAHLHALEVTDLEKKGSRTTAHFYDGSKPEYPRRMHCIQGSDAHRLTVDPKHPERLGVGDRLTEVRLDERTFEALCEALTGTDFSVLRPARALAVAPYDYVREAREAGNTIVQAFHEGATHRGGRLYAVLADAVAFANTNGGTIYIGASPQIKNEPLGVTNAEQMIPMLRREIENRVTPPLELQIDVQESEGKSFIRIQVPRGHDSPYAIDGGKIYVRNEDESDLAVRDEIVELVKRAVAARPQKEIAVQVPDTLTVQPPRTGVEITSAVEQKGKRYYTMSDLRRGSQVQNVTRSSARRLWHYAIVEAEKSPVRAENVQWQGDIGLVKDYRQNGRRRFDLAQRVGDQIRIYYGVSEEGMHGEWKALAGIEDE